MLFRKWFFCFEATFVVTFVLINLFNTNQDCIRKVVGCTLDNGLNMVRLALVIIPTKLSHHSGAN